MKNVFVAAFVIYPFVDANAITFHPVITMVSSISVPLTFSNSAGFRIMYILTNKQKKIEIIEHGQKMEQSLITQNVDKALLILFKEIFNKSLQENLNKRANIGSIALHNLHRATQNCKHIERNFDKERQLDVDAVELEFKARIDTSQLLEKYFERQQ